MISRCDRAANYPPKASVIIVEAFWDIISRHLETVFPNKKKRINELKNELRQLTKDWNPSEEDLKELNGMIETCIDKANSNAQQKSKRVNVEEVEKTVSS